MKEGGPNRYIHADHLSTPLKTSLSGTAIETDLSGSVAAERRYLAFGGERDSSGNLRTENQFTSQKLDGTGLYYYGARYYNPEIGQFISPDTIVPAPGAVFAYNRYMYAYGNPLKYVDPSGHVAVCFKGGAGNAGTEATVEGFLQQCQQTLFDAGYNEAIHGPILTLFNGVEAIEYANERVRAEVANDPNQPVVIAGYSWGGAAALDLAHVLNGEVMTSRGTRVRNESVEVDLLFLIDPEEDLRGVASTFRGEDSRRARTFVPANVGRAVNVFAGDAAKESVPFSIPLPFGRHIDVQIPFWEPSPQNGMNNVRGALNVELSESNTGQLVTHETIRSVPETYDALRSEVERILR